MLRLKPGFTCGGTSSDGRISACSAPPELVSRAGARPRCLSAFPSPINLHLHPLPLSISRPAGSPSKVPTLGALGGSCRPAGVWAGGAG